MGGARRGVFFFLGLVLCLFAFIVYYQSIYNVKVIQEALKSRVKDAFPQLCEKCPPPTAPICVDNQSEYWKTLDVSKATPKDVIDYFYWTNRSSCGLIHDFGGVMLKNPSGFDGQKAVCLDKIAAPKPGNCIVYSFGINNEWSFDDAMEKYGCEVFAFDPSMNVRKKFDRTKMIHFYPTGLGERDYVDKESGWHIKSLRSIYNQLGHEGRIIDYLKMDIESAEWVALPQILESGMMSKVRQLALEFHWSSTADLDGFRKYVALLHSLENGPGRMIRFDSKYNPWFTHQVPALNNYTGSLGFEIAWYQILPN